MKARVNPDVERLEAEVARLRRELDARRADPGDSPLTGCGDHGCLVVTPRGMGTNGGCQCEARELRRAVQWWRRVAAFREETVRELRARPVDGGAEDERAAVVAYVRAEAEANYDEGSERHEMLTDLARWLDEGLHTRKAKA